MRFSVIVAALALVITAPGARASDPNWLHVFVDEQGEGREKVRINVPFDLLESIVEIIDEEEFSGGRVSLDDSDLDAAEVRALLRAVGEAEEGEYVTVEREDEEVRVAKKGDFVHVRVRDRQEASRGDEEVDIRVHRTVLDALAAGEGEDLDVLAAIRALGASGGGELLTVNDGSSSVRIWVDTKASGE
jgi:hypothetical protein